MLDFHDLGRYRENNRIEAKKAQGGLPHSIWETYSAFANTVGGVILLGVIEQPPEKTLQPVPLPDPEWLAEEFWRLVNDPAVASSNILRRQDVQIIEADGLPIVAIEVPHASRRERPVYIGQDPIHGAYRRNGEGDYHCTSQEVRAMLRERGDPAPDSRLLTQLDPRAFHWDTVSRYRAQMAALRPGHRWLRLNHLELLCRLGAAGYGPDRRAHPTAAGLLMFGKASQIRTLYPHYHLEFREPASDRHSVRRISTGLPGWSGNLYDFYTLMCDRFAAAPPPGGQPVQLALREAVANALIHADYSAEQGLLVLRRPSSIFIRNPGCMRVPAGAALTEGISDPRNETLMELFHQVDVAQHTGSGLPGIRAVWEAQGWQAPVLREFLSPDCTLLTLRLPRSGVRLRPQRRRIGPVRQAVLDILRDQVQARPSQLARSLGVPRDQIEAVLCRLTDEQLVVPTGTGRNCVYRLRS